MGKVIFGVDLGGTTVKMGYFDTEGNVKDKWEIPTRKDENGKNILPDIAASIVQHVVNREHHEGQEVVNHAHLHGGDVV